MLVFGKHPAEVELGAVRRPLEVRLHEASRAWLPTREALRTILILAGQLEQAVEDLLERERRARRALGSVRAATGHAAAALLESGAPAARRELQRAASALERAAELDRERALLRVPEGYAFYALFPEQYALAAERWLADRRGPPGVALILGLRTIGTSLGALVAARLRAAGWRSRCLTTRPRGHPFAREVVLPRTATDGVDAALVVDEGPGLSGSSLLGAARALRRAGLATEQIALLPGHAGAPGLAAGEGARREWQRAARYHVPLAELRLEGSPWQGDDLGAGRWRAVACQGQAWPPACPPFERPKYLLPGAAPRLAKFAGLCAGEHGLTRGEAARARLIAQAAVTGAPAPELAHGFLVRPWLDGRLLRAEDLDGALLDRIGAHVAAVAGAPLSPAEAEAAQTRLATMLLENARGLLGEAAALPVPLPAPGQARAGDGRLAPHEWLRSGSALIKLDAEAHDDDHTVVGPQPVAWDLAGACVEWALDEPARQRLLGAFTTAGGGSPSRGALRACRLAYAAFRGAQHALCRESCQDVAEAARLGGAVARYRAELRRALAEPDALG